MLKSVGRVGVRRFVLLLGREFVQAMQLVVDYFVIERCRALLLRSERRHKETARCFGNLIFKESTGVTTSLDYYSAASERISSSLTLMDLEPWLLVA